MKQILRKKSNFIWFIAGANQSIGKLAAGTLRFQFFSKKTKFFSILVNILFQKFNLCIWAFDKNNGLHLTFSNF